MRPELQAKLLQHLNKKKADKGFTLVELLVVIVIIGILTAIALPSFLNQTAKAKQAEAKQNVSTVLKTEQSWRTENSAFTTSFDSLALGTLAGAAGDVSSTKTFNYTLTSAGNNDTEINITADSRDVAVKSYAGRTEVAANATSQIAWTTLMCEANTPASVTMGPLASTVPGAVVDGKAACPSAIAATVVQ
jgi:type IV pilus assembly protein PilA